MAARKVARDFAALMVSFGGGVTFLSLSPLYCFSLYPRCVERWGFFEEYIRSTCLRLVFSSFVVILATIYTV